MPSKTTRPMKIYYLDNKQIFKSIIQNTI